MTDHETQFEANPTVNGGMVVGSEANPTTDGRVYGALARAEALRAGHPAWWEVTAWPCDEWEPQGD